MSADTKKSDPKKDPVFQKVVRKFLDTPPRPRPKREREEKKRGEGKPTPRSPQTK